MKVKDLQKAELSYWVAKGEFGNSGCFADSYKDWYDGGGDVGLSYTRDWTLAGPLVEKHWAAIRYFMKVWFGKEWTDKFAHDEILTWFMRCVVASVYGEEVEV